MKTIQIQIIWALLLLAGASLLTASAAQQQRVGRITDITGATSLHRASNTSAVTTDTTVYTADELVSGVQGFMRLAMNNGASVTILPNSALKLVGDTGKYFAYQLKAGGAHIITDHPAQLVSASGSVTTSGADFDNMQCDGNCFHSTGKPYPDGLYVWVKRGSAKITADNTATARVSRQPVRLAWAGQSAVYRPQMSDAGNLRLAAADGSSGTSASAGSVVYVAAGAAPATLSTVPDFFLSAKFKTSIHIPKLERIEKGVGLGGSSGPTKPGGGGGGSVVPVSPN